MTAKYFRIPLEVIIVDKEMEQTTEIKEKKGNGKYPFLETENGTILFQSTAIAGYIARQADDTGFLGKDAFTEAQVEQWLGYTNQTLTGNMIKHVCYVWGYHEDQAGANQAAKALKESAKLIDKHLQGKDWLVGERLTLADIVIWNNLKAPFVFAYDAEFCKAIPNLCDWYRRLNRLPFIAGTAGMIKIKSDLKKTDGQTGK